MSGRDGEEEEDVKWVGQGLDAPIHSPADPQAYLQGSNHPYSPFVGNALTWESWVADDGTQYEGLMRERIPHGKGVMTFGNGYGAGIQECERGDKYEGEFAAGFAHGLGMYTSVGTGEVYRGEWIAGKKDGCGVLTNMNPFYQLVAKGVDPHTAWEEAKDSVKEGERWGTWQSDYFAAGPDETGQFCAKEEIEGTLEELEGILTRARMFQHKPDGDVTFTTMQDAQGKPITLFQDPMHYPHHTGFLMPGPAGQCFPIPADPTLRAHMEAAERNYARIYNQFNFDIETKPGSDMEKAEKLWNKQLKETQKERKRLEAEEKRRLKRLEAKGSTTKGSGLKEEEVGEEEEEEEEDLIAAATAAAAAAADSHTTGASGESKDTASGNTPKRPSGFRPTAFGSVSLSLSRASLHANNVLSLIARKADKRRSLTRPRC